MKKVTILALHLGYGGIENAVATLANLLCEKYEVEIIFAKGIILIILLFIFAFCIVGQMDPYNNGCLV